MGLLHKVLGRYAGRKLAAQVGTDSAMIYAIAPEMLWYVIKEGDWLRVVDDEGWAETKKLSDIIREHGGAVFNTGSDGMWDVDLSSDTWNEDRVKGEGSKSPYGTKDYITNLKKKIKDNEKAKDENSAKKTAGRIKVDRGLAGRIADVISKRLILALESMPKGKPLGDRSFALIEPFLIPVKLLDGQVAYAKTSVLSKRRDSDWRNPTHQVIPGGHARQFAESSDPSRIVGWEIDIYVNGNFTPTEILTKFVGKGTERWSLKANVRRVLLHEMTHLVDPGLKIPPGLADYYNRPTEVRARMQEVVDQVLTDAERAAADLEGFTTIKQLVEHGLDQSPTWEFVRKRLNDKSRRVVLKAVYQAVSERKGDFIDKYMED